MFVEELIIVREGWVVNEVIALGDSVTFLLFSDVEDFALVVDCFWLEDNEWVWSVVVATIGTDVVPFEGASVDVLFWAPWVTFLTKIVEWVGGNFVVWKVLVLSAGDDDVTWDVISVEDVVWIWAMLGMTGLPVVVCVAWLLESSLVDGDTEICLCVVVLTEEPSSPFFFVVCNDFADETVLRIIVVLSVGTKFLDVELPTDEVTKFVAAVDRL